MAIYTLMSPGGSPGVTTTALAVTHAWGGRALLAECDPTGGDVLSGFLAGRMEADHGSLLDLALAIAHNPDPSVLWQHVVSLDHDAREWLLLPGLHDPRQVAQLDGAWDQITEVFRTACDDAVDVVADVGQLGGVNSPMRLIAGSDLAVMLLKPTLRQMSAAKPRLDALGRYVGSSVPVGLCLIGRGEYDARRVSESLYGLPVIAEIPHDPRSAAVLSDGVQTRRPIRMSRLMQGGSALAIAMRRRLAESLADQDRSAEVIPLPSEPYGSRQKEGTSR